MERPRYNRDFTNLLITARTCSSCALYIVVLCIFLCTLYLFLFLFSQKANEKLFVFVKVTKTFVL